MSQVTPSSRVQARLWLRQQINRVRRPDTQVRIIDYAIFPVFLAILMVFIFAKKDSVAAQLVPTLLSAFTLIAVTLRFSRDAAHSAFSKLLDEWRSDEMATSIQYLYKWRKKTYPQWCTQDRLNPAVILVPPQWFYPETRKTEYISGHPQLPMPLGVYAFRKWYKEGQSDSRADLQALNKHRRRVSQFFHRLRKNANYHRASRFAAKDTFDFRDLRILWQIVEPLNEVISDNDRSDVYDWFRELYKAEYVEFNRRRAEADESQRKKRVKPLLFADCRLKYKFCYTSINML